MVPNARISSSTLSEGGTARLVCTPCILAEANLKAEVTSLMRKIPKNMQLQIDRLRKRLDHERQRRTPSDSSPSYDDNRDGSYRPKSRTPPSEPFLCNEDCHYKRRIKSPSHEGLGNDAISRALNQISKSPFIRRIEKGKASSTVYSANIHHV